jgi:hypothetical protein
VQTSSILVHLPILPIDHFHLPQTLLLIINSSR